MQLPDLLTRTAGCHVVAGDVDIDTEAIVKEFEEHTFDPLVSFLLGQICMKTDSQLVLGTSDTVWPEFQA